jgi:hypothetical protein
MQYKIIDHRWQKIHIDEYILRNKGFDSLQEIEHNENLDIFEKLVQECVSEGWTPLGAPIFTEGWCKQDSGLPRRMYQAMVLHNSSTSEKKELDKTIGLDESDTITSSYTSTKLLPTLVPHPPLTKRFNRSSSSQKQINLKSPRTTRSEKLRQEFLKQVDK